MSTEITAEQASQIVIAADDAYERIKWMVISSYALLDELRRILEISEAVREHCSALEKEAIRRVIKNREAAAPFVEKLRAEEARWLNESNPWTAQIAVWQQKDFSALTQRTDACCSDHSVYAEPKTISASF